jgi:hypothetical protein
MTHPTLLRLTIKQTRLAPLQDLHNKRLRQKRLTQGVGLFKGVS